MTISKGFPIPSFQWIKRNDHYGICVSNDYNNGVMIVVAHFVEVTKPGPAKEGDPEIKTIQENVIWKRHVFTRTDGRSDTGGQPPIGGQLRNPADFLRMYRAAVADAEAFMAAQINSSIMVAGVMAEAEQTAKNNGVT